jgi:hypothetical protein
MDPKTGELYEIYSELDAKLRGLVAVPAEDVEHVKQMSLQDRLKWLEIESHLRRHPLGGVADPEELRKIKNALKAERRERRGK